MTGNQEPSENSPVYDLFYKVTDPNSQIMGSPVPAMTSVLYNVCGRDHDKFDEAVRLVELFMLAAYEKGKSENAAGTK